MVEQKIDFEIFAADFDGVLAADKGKANSEFEEELPEMFEETSLQILFARRKLKLYGSSVICCARSDCGGGSVR